ncbi:MAG: sugar kinase [Deinococcales bacterium]
MTSQTAQTRFDISAIGETMLRLSQLTGDRLRNMRQLHVHAGGAETNVLSALSSLGRRCTWASALPDHDIGHFVLRELAANKIDTGAVVFKGSRLGIYYLEFASAPRPINVIYDRAHAAITELKASDLNWDYLLNTRLLHLTGITPALSSSCYELTQEAIRQAKTRRVKVSFDINYRSKLWSGEQAAEALKPLMQDVDLLICGEGDAETVFGLKGHALDILAGLQELSKAEHIILTQSSRGSSTLIKGNLVQAEAMPAEVIDRLGAGDAFAAGVIDGYLDGDIVAGMQQGSCLSAIALSQHGDMVITSRSELNSILEKGHVKLSR